MNSAPSNSDGLVLRMDFDAVTNGRVQERVSGTSVPVLRDLAGLAGVIEGRLNVPGDTRSYSFTIDERTLVAFDARSEEHTSELQSLVRISYAVFCLKKKRLHDRVEHTSLLSNVRS